VDEPADLALHLGWCLTAFPQVEELEFGPSSLILVPLLCGLKKYGIVSSALPTESFLIVNLIEQ
jgi:hypothetical protein